MIRAGSKVKMSGERQRYTVRAADQRFVVLTKPFNAQRTYLYSIVDLELGVRGPCNFIFGLPFVEELTTPEGARKCLEMLVSGEMEVSRRRSKPLEESELEQFA